MVLNAALALLAMAAAASEPTGTAAESAARTRAAKTLEAAVRSASIIVNATADAVVDAVEDAVFRGSVAEPPRAATARAAPLDAIAEASKDAATQRAGDFAAWFEATCEGGFVGEGLRQDAGGARDVVATRGAAAGEVLARVPQHCAVTEAYARDDLARMGLGDALADAGLPGRHVLPLWLAAARREAGHALAPYFATLPDVSDHPVAWPARELARTLPASTRDRIHAFQDHVQASWRALAGAVDEAPSFAGFRDATALVLSRGLRSREGPVLVPLVDAFNHGAAGANVALSVDGDAFGVAAAADVAPGAPLRFAYARTSNEQLFARYGVTPDGGRDVATVELENALYAIETPTPEEHAAAAAAGLDPASFGHAHRPFVAAVAKRSAATGEEPADVLYGVLLPAFAELPLKEHELQRRLAAAAPGSTRKHGLRLTLGVGNVLIAWANGIVPAARRAAAAARERERAARHPIRITADRPDGVRLGWLDGDDACVDHHEACGSWARHDECATNPDYMLERCPAACGVVACAAPEPMDFEGPPSDLDRGQEITFNVGHVLVARRGDDVLFSRRVDKTWDEVRVTG